MEEIGVMMPALIFLAVVMSVGFLVSIIDFFMDVYKNNEQ